MFHSVNLVKRQPNINVFKNRHFLKWAQLIVYDNSIAQYSEQKKRVKAQLYLCFHS